MKKFDFDLFIIGAGSGGVRAGRVAASHGAKVGIAEENYLGGTCVNVGCVPKKLFVYASYFSEEFENCKSYGWDVEKTNFNWQKLISNKNQEILRLNKIYEKLLNESGVEIIYGKAKLIDNNTININKNSISAEKILIATGAWPTIPDLPGKEFIISSNDAFHLDALPEKVIVVGGGYIGAEFAGIFNGLGVDTTLVYRGHKILKGFDTESGEFLSQEIVKKGIKLLLNTTIDSISKNDNDVLKIDLNTGQTIDTNMILYATGRHPNTAGLGLTEIGIKLDESDAIIINSDFQSSIPSIYAIGDVTNRYNLTPVAISEGIKLANDLYGNNKLDMDYENIPTCIFSQPNFATVGLSEESAREHNIDISIYKTQFKHMKHSLSDNTEQTFMKLVVDNISDKVIGAHMVGHDAGEIIQGIAIAIKAGATKADFDSTIGIHPTAAEEFVTMRNATT
ncbi:MAG: glutathione reductase (NADPH) [Gammaproteobacteria bacterium]|jgi:glutathione reductase (NADPH)